MNLTLPGIIQELLVYKYFFLFPVAVLEGPIISVIGGFLVAGGVFHFWITYAVLIAGDIVGDTFYYLIGYWGRAGLINRWGHLIGLTPERLHTIEKHFHHHAGKTLLGGKFSQVAGGGILVAAGAAKMRYSKFIGYNLIATIPKSFALLLLGYYFGEAYAQIDKYFSYAAWALGGALILGVLIYWFIKRKKK